MSSVYAPVPIGPSIELQPQPQPQSLKPDYLDEFDTDEFDDLPLIAAAAGGPGGGGTASGVPGAVFNLATSIIGAGIMALPAAMKVLGIALGFISIVLMGILSEISIELLVRFSAHCKSASYGDAVNSAVGHPAKILSELCIIVNNAGILVAYLIIIGDVMSGSEDHTGVLDQLFGTGIWNFRRLVILLGPVLQRR